jgi:transposase
MNNTTTITIDLAKDVFQMAVCNKYDKILINKAISPKKVRRFVSSHPGG